MRTILFNTPMTVNSIYQSASVIEFQERYNGSNKMLVRLDVEPYAPRITAATNTVEYIAVTIDKNGTVYGTTTDGKRVPLTKTPYTTPESTALTQVGEMWVGSCTRFYSDEIADFVDEATGRTIEVHEDNFYRVLNIGDSLIMTSKLGYRDTTIERVGDGSYTLDGRTDTHGKTYSESQAFAHMCKWYGATVSHRIVRA